MTLLTVKDLNIVFPGKKGPITVSDNICFDMKEGESLCLVGESGCGKTMVALGIMRLLPEDASISGTIEFKGRDLLSMKDKALRKIRGRNIAMIFEQPTTCLNPVFTVGEQIAEVFREHEKFSRKESKDMAVELMRKMGIDAAEKRYHHYPHEFSGGMVQRAMIAMALALRPALLIADEPTTSLDVTIQNRIIELLKQVTAEFRTSLLLISHDLGIASRLCDKIAVIYAGWVAEYGMIRDVFENPRHPYTLALLDAASGREFHFLDGSVPAFSQLPDGCRFHPRCPRSRNLCRKIMPEMNEGVRCHFHRQFSNREAV